MIKLQVGLKLSHLLLGINQHRNTVLILITKKVPASEASLKEKKVLALKMAG